jgi:hypothetical protein
MVVGVGNQSEGIARGDANRRGEVKARVGPNTIGGATHRGGTCEGGHLCCRNNDLADDAIAIINNKSKAAVRRDGTVIREIKSRIGPNSIGRSRYGHLSRQSGHSRGREVNKANKIIACISNKSKGTRGRDGHRIRAGEPGEGSNAIRRIRRNTSESRNNNISASGGERVIAAEQERERDAHERIAELLAATATKNHSTPNHTKISTDSILRGHTYLEGTSRGHTHGHMDTSRSEIRWS